MSLSDIAKKITSLGAHAYLGAPLLRKVLVHLCVRTSWYSILLIFFNRHCNGLLTQHTIIYLMHMYLFSRRRTILFVSKRAMNTFEILHIKNYTCTLAYYSTKIRITKLDISQISQTLYEV